MIKEELAKAIYPYLSNEEKKELIITGLKCYTQNTLFLRLNKLIQNNGGDRR